MSSWSPYNYTFNNPISHIDPSGMQPVYTGYGYSETASADVYVYDMEGFMSGLEEAFPNTYIPNTAPTKYEDEEGNELLVTDDGSKDVVTVPNEDLEEFQEIVAISEEYGTTEELDNKYWNDNVKARFLGFESIEEMEATLSNTTFRFSRNQLIAYIQSESTGDLFLFAGVEIISQWCNPMNHLPTRIKVKAITPKSSNPWNRFRREMGKGAYTKKKYGNSNDAAAARKAAYNKWKTENE